ncbi:hypothetical protein BV898_18523 [Hypsibius exemplaris]|uniref:CUB domain-containing protein n=1 Tax=Hypsibius exemplaris TaxID=2072580 RepID=A0A9X6NJV4_HYPEX|nr:hypothetical protein BV898_18523 [Hypsibius exemplaris]
MCRVVVQLLFLMIVLTKLGLIHGSICDQVVQVSVDESTELQVAYDSRDNGTNCRYEIISPPGFGLMIKSSIQVEEFSVCDGQVVFRVIDELNDLENGTVQTCGTASAPFKVAVPLTNLSSNSMIVTVTSELKSEGTIFNIDAHALCSTSLTLAASGPERSLTLRLPEFPTDYPRWISCTFAVEAPLGFNIQVESIINFNQLNASETCSDRLHFVEVDLNSTALDGGHDHFCNQSGSRRFISETNSVVIKFDAKSRLSWTGFEAHVTAILVDSSTTSRVASSSATTSAGTSQTQSSSTTATIMTTTSGLPITSIISTTDGSSSSSWKVVVPAVIGSFVLLALIVTIVMYFTNVATYLRKRFLPRTESMMPLHESQGHPYVEPTPVIYRVSE